MKNIKIRRFVVIINALVLAVVGIIASLNFHELGHAMMAYFAGLEIGNYHIGFLSYVDINANNATNFQLALVSLGSFILPEIIYLALMFFKNMYITIFRIFSGMLLLVNILINAVLLFVSTVDYREYDILMFRHYSGVKSIIIAFALVAVLLINVILELLSGRIKKCLNEIFDIFV